MDIVAARNLQFQTLDRFGAKHGDSLKLPIAFREKKRVQAFVPPCRRTSSPSKLACSRHKSKATLEAGGFQVTIDEELVLKNNLRVFEQHLKGRCIYLVGMMGSGKTTVGKILSEVLKYDFYDCDKLVEDEVGGTSVADIFKHYGEDFFREKETGTLQKLSVMDRLVIATGGGAVIRPINWKYMHKGISIWLDVPIEALAHRITAVGTGSRPLLHNETGDAYTQTLMRLSSLLEARLEAYANANVTVSLANVAANLGNKDVLDLSPITIAIEALMQITGFLKNGGGHYDGCKSLR